MVSFYCFKSFDNKKNNILPIFLLLLQDAQKGQAPFSARLPAARAAPAPISALVHSLTLVGVFGYLTNSETFGIKQCSVKLFLNKEKCGFLHVVQKPYQVKIGPCVGRSAS